MKHYIGTLDIFFDEHCTQNLVLIHAANEAQARALLNKHAKDWVGDAAKLDDPSDEYYTSEETMAAARVTTIVEVSPAVAASLKDHVEVLGNAVVGSLAEEPEDERVKTLARRVGSQLSKLECEVPLGKLLKAVSASIGKTDWQVLLASTRAPVAPEAPGCGQLVEGRQLWVITGRCFKDDDDSLGIFWVDSFDEAKDVFIRTVLNLKEEDLAEDNDRNPLYFLCRDEKLAEVVNGKLVFNQLFQPS